MTSLPVALFHESKLTLKLAFPLMIGQLSQMLLGVVDTVMVGHLGVTNLAALTFANAMFHVPFVFGMGLLTGVSVMTSNSRGAEDTAGARGSCRHGVYLATVLGLALFGIAWVISLNLHWFGQPPEVAARTPLFFQILMASAVPGLISIALKNHSDALNRPWPAFWIFLGGVAMNIFLNWVMIHGRLGCPVFGFEGAAWATLISRSAMMLAMFGWFIGSKRLREWMPHRWFRKPDWADVKSLLSVGFPASFHMLCEVSAFSLAGLVMGRFGPDAMAAHQIALTMAATAFMIPLGLSMALTVRLGEANGAGEQARLRPIVISGWMLAVGYSVASAILFMLLGTFLASLFISSAGVIHMAAALLVIVGVFQIFDSLQVGSAGMLRGLKDARVPALMGFAAYWLVGLPVGAGLAFGAGMGPAGVWWGLATGLAVASVAMGARLWNRTRS